MTPATILQIFWGALAFMSFGGIAALVFSRWPRFSARLGVGTALAGCLMGLSAVGAGFASNHPFQSVLRIPFGGVFYLHFGFDPLSLFFAGLTLLLGFVTALYGYGYLQKHGEDRSTGPHWFCFNGLLAAILLVFLARDAIGFLIAWELMALTSLGLVLHDHEIRRVRQAGWLYLVACHMGAALVLLFFLILAHDRGGFAFSTFIVQQPGGFTPHAHWLFFLAVVGFGTKAGFMPMHVWLPEAHPAAPSHVSALMSGIMIKTGIYGLLRALEWLGPWVPVWGWALVLIGLSSGLLGALFALANNDLKQLLAYSSIDNMGILALGIGIGVLGVTYHLPLMAVAGFTGALFHLINHAFFKGLLFLSAGAVYQATGTRQISRLGGLFKTMPRTASCFLIGSVAICALPPLNGCIGEFLIYWGAFKGYLADPTSSLAPLLITLVAGLALIGGLVVATFTKSFGIAFLGEPRTRLVPPPRDPGRLLLIPMFLLAVACFSVTFFAPWVAAGLDPVINQISAAGGVLPDAPLPLPVLFRPLSIIAVSSAFILVAALVLFWLRHRWLQRRPVNQGLTWDCGYAQPNARMQYTPTSFAQPLLDPFTPLLNRRIFARIPRTLFPDSSTLSTGSGDLFQIKIFVPMVRSLNRGIKILRWIQTGRVQVYVLYIVIALIGVILWSFAS